MTFGDRALPDRADERRQTPLRRPNLTALVEKLRLVNGVGPGIEVDAVLHLIARVVGGCENESAGRQFDLAEPGRELAIVEQVAVASPESPASTKCA